MTAAPSQFEDLSLLEEKLNKNKIPQELYQRAQTFIERLARIASTREYSQEYDQVARYLEWISSLPWEKRTTEILSLAKAKKILDVNHYDLENIKERILEYISIALLKKDQDKIKAPAFLFQGLVGTGKTTMAYSIAQCLGRQFGRVPMGGMGDAVQMRGRSRIYPESEPGMIMKVLRRVQTKNPVILLDEIDRVSSETRADIMGVLVELLDPEQNNHFIDHFIDYPFDLSEVLFIATANNTTNIATAVLDRLEIIEMPSYSDEQKILIGKNYLVPKAMNASGLSGSDLVFQEETWPQIVRPLGFDAGMRTLDRTINAICRKIAKLKVEGQTKRVTVTPENLKEYVTTW